jgi:hypothetical protein
MSLAGEFTPDWESSTHPDNKYIGMHLQHMSRVERERRYNEENERIVEEILRKPKTNPDDDFSDLTNEI